MSKSQRLNSVLRGQQKRRNLSIKKRRVTNTPPTRKAVYYKLLIKIVDFEFFAQCATANA